MINYPLTVARSKAALRDAIRSWRYSGHTIGLVPTMGALHNGHVSLVAGSRARASKTVVSIYVNPAQFAPGEDFDTYPRTEAADLARLEAAGVDLVYLPQTGEMYPEGTRTDVRVNELSDKLDGIYRPHFFYGVATVVARLFIHVEPDVAVFGEKDFQQLQVIRRMVADLGFAIEIVGAPTHRDADGLAQSSRNAYLSAEERRSAGALFASLTRAQARLRAGAPLEEVLAEARSLLVAADFTKVDYVEAVNSATLETLTGPRETWPAETRLLGAAWMGRTRLIDNISLG